MAGLERFIGEVLDEKYRLERLLGEGGMGAVYLATHLGTERPVALKIISPQFMRNDEFVERFKREARAAGRLRHPNVVDVTDFGFARAGADRVAYLVMEYLDGCTLGDVLAEESRLPLDWVVDILEQVCSAVDEAHRQGIVHRDLKPDNIWLEPNALGGYRIKVLDFGIAKLADPIAVEANGNSSRASLSAPTQTQVPLSSAQTAHVSPPRATEFKTGDQTRHETSSSEAATQLLSRETVDEDLTRTLALPSPSADMESSASEAATQIQTPAALSASTNDDADKTRLLPTLRKATATQHAATAAVTRVGAILGTPLYMSPEQCRGESSDARSDVYSLGVIAYQMLAGETPFKGDTLTVMKQHQDASVPALRVKNRKVSPRVERLVMSALAKSPHERPPGAVAFSNALRANAEGVGSLLRRSFALYSEHFPTFLRVSLLAHLPVIALTLLLICYDMMQSWQRAHPVWSAIAAAVLGLLSITANFLTASAISGFTVLIVTQLTLAPLRPIDLRAAVAFLKKRWRPFLRTSIRVSLTIFAGFALFFIPGLIVIVRYALYAPVVLLEGLQKRAALRRANELSRRSRRAVIAIMLIEFLFPVLLSLIVGRIVMGAIKGGESHLLAKIYSRLVELSNIVIIPLVSIMTALLYLKLRQAGGETLRETLEQLDDQQVPRSQWQQRMRERLSLHTSANR